MGVPFGSEAWASALVDEINASSEYRNAGAKWGDGFNGNLLFVFEADGADPGAASRSLLIRLAGGRCGGAEFLDGDTHPDAGFTLRAPFALWRDVLERRAMAATAILTGKMRVDGDKMTLLKHTSANRTLIHCTASIETDWP